MGAHIRIRADVSAANTGADRDVKVSPHAIQFHASTLHFTFSALLQTTAPTRLTSATASRATFVTEIDLGLYSSVRCSAAFVV